MASTYDGETLKAYTDGILVSANTAPSRGSRREVAPLWFGSHDGNDWAGSGR